MTQHFYSLKKASQKASRRSGATTVESAVVLGVFVLLLFGMLELGVALVRHTVICEAARRVGRAAIVHGAQAKEGSWGPATVNTNAASNHPVAAIARSVLMTLDPVNVQITVVWPDGSHDPDDRVQVTVTTTHIPIIPTPGSYSELELRAESMMRIAH